MSGGFKLFDDGDSAVANGTPFRVAYFIGEDERFLYFRSEAEAFAFVQDHPTIESPEIRDLEHCEVLFPKGAAA